MSSIGPVLVYSISQGGKIAAGRGRGRKGPTPVVRFISQLDVDTKCQHIGEVVFRGCQEIGPRAFYWSTTGINRVLWMPSASLYNQHQEGKSIHRTSLTWRHRILLIEVFGNSFAWRTSPKAQDSSNAIAMEPNERVSNNEVELLSETRAASCSHSRRTF